MSEKGTEKGTQKKLKKGLLKSIKVIYNNLNISHATRRDERREGMNNDIYAEWLVKRKKSPLTVPFYIGIVLLFLIGFYVSVISPFGFVALPLPQQLTLEVRVCMLSMNMYLSQMSWQLTVFFHSAHASV